MNATVTMPVGDLDKLRNDLKDAQDKIKEFEKNEKSITVIRYNVDENRSYALRLGPGRHNHMVSSMDAYNDPRIAERVCEKVVEKRNVEDIKELLKREVEKEFEVRLNEYAANNSSLKQEVRNLKDSLDKEVEDRKKIEVHNAELKYEIDSLKGELDKEKKEGEEARSLLSEADDLISTSSELFTKLSIEFEKEKKRKGFWSFLR